MRIPGEANDTSKAGPTDGRDPRREATAAHPTRREFLASAPVGAALAGAAVGVVLGSATAPARGAASERPAARVPGLVDTSQKFGRYRVNATIERPPPAVVTGFRNVAREVVTEHLGRSQLMDPALKPLLGRDWNVVGPAVTVDLDAFDHLMCIAAIGVARPGDVIVVAARGLTDLAVWGGGLTMSAKNVGVEAIVVDGAVMDTRAILAREVPVFCRGSHPAHGTREKPGSVNVPVTVGDVIVHPGDLILGDLDGLMVVRREDAARVLAACEEKTAALRRAAAAMAGQQPRTFFDLIGGKDTVVRAGVEWID
jgi:4-hydroxy-4-methyl-2-oxoglutarate aldolase